MAKFTGHVRLNKTNYQIEGQLIVNDMSGEAKLVEVKKEDKEAKKSTYMSSDSASISASSMKLEVGQNSVGFFFK